MYNTKKIKLNSGYEMPIIGLGTWMITGEDKVEQSLRNAIKSGYRHIDTAFIYGNEKCIGKALKKIFTENIIKREDLFITSKLWCTYHDNPHEALKITLSDLQLDYIDLYLVHWPIKYKTDTNHQPIKSDDNKNLLDEFDCTGLWKDMEDLVNKGLTKSIGVANFGIHNLQKILQNCTIKPAIDQFEIHPYLNQVKLVDFCHKNNINVVSYSSLGGSNPQKLNLKEDQDILKIAEKYQKTVPQVILSWLVQRDILVIPKSSSESHLKENMDLFILDEEDFTKISELNKNYRFISMNNISEDVFK